ncbi:hypothetical protein IGI37_002283 [Enterococcus sp. AZ194]|uniref:hypothetical protein n=1 Tax=Enterococcus sp. AZ194 TaxID=2774629 RepID=UPI003F230476
MNLKEKLCKEISELVDYAQTLDEVDLQNLIADIKYQSSIHDSMPVKNTFNNIVKLLEQKQEPASLADDTDH